LRVRGIKVSPKTTADEIRKIVDDHHTNPLGPPKVIRETTPTAKEMRHLLVAGQAFLFDGTRVKITTSIMYRKTTSRTDVFVDSSRNSQCRRQVAKGTRSAMISRIDIACDIVLKEP
jgi:hypothetical protein